MVPVFIRSAGILTNTPNPKTPPRSSLDPEAEVVGVEKFRWGFWLIAMNSEL
jgi:hypothetical protein